MYSRQHNQHDNERSRSSLLYIWFLYLRLEAIVLIAVKYDVNIFEDEISSLFCFVRNTECAMSFILDVNIIMLMLIKIH